MGALETLPRTDNTEKTVMLYRNQDKRYVIEYRMKCRHAPILDCVNYRSLYLLSCKVGAMISTGTEHRAKVYRCLETWNTLLSGEITSTLLLATTLNIVNLYHY